MNNTPVYKSLKVSFQVWQVIARIIAQTGETRTRLIERLVTAEEERIGKGKPGHKDAL